MALLSFWFLVIFISCLDSISSYSCDSDEDCELLGTCVNNACECKPGFQGPSCGTLKLGAAPNPRLGVWPLAESHANEDTYSWGFTVAKPLNTNEDGTYHAWVNQGCYNTSLGMVSGCFLLHVTSASATSNFTAQEIMMPASSFNPHINIIYSTLEKQYLMFFRINDLDAGYPVCIGNKSQSTLALHNKHLTANSLDVATSESPYGPWNVTALKIVNMPQTHISNPSVIQLDNGTFVMAYRFNTNAEWVGIAVSSTTQHTGPYQNIANLSVPGEDPFIWRDQKDGSFHLLFHVENGQAYSEWPSLHAWSVDLYHWNVSQSFDRFQTGAYSTNVTWTDGTQTMFNRRERPEIMFDDNGVPLYFYSAVQEMRTANETGFPYSYSVVQEFL